MALQIYTDGGSRGNPGPAAAGVVIRDDQGRAILEAGYFLGKATNNVAEYTALLLALEAARKFGALDIQLFADSELMVKQLTGKYKVRDPHLAELFKKAKLLLVAFESWKITHIFREQNRRADALANKALDAKRDVVEIQLGDAQPAGRTQPAASPEQTGAPAPVPAQAPAPTIPPVIVKVLRGPQSGGCKGGTAAGQTFVFGETAPANMCVYALKAVLDTILAMRYAAGENETLMPVRVRCPRRGCGAEFDVRLSAPAPQDPAEPDNLF